MLVSRMGVDSLTSARETRLDHRSSLWSHHRGRRPEPIRKLSYSIHQNPDYTGEPPCPGPRSITLKKNAAKALA
jgi:hypothetical protein